MNIFDPLNYMSGEEFDEETDLEDLGDSDGDIETAMHSSVWLDEDVLLTYSKDQLIRMIKDSKTELKRQIEIMDQVKDKLKVGRSVEGYFWILEYQPDNPPREETLQMLSEKYLDGEPVVGLPEGTTLLALGDKQLKRLGLKRTSMDEATKDAYDSMLSRG